MATDLALPKRRKLPWRRHITPTEVLLGHPYSGSGSEDDPFIVEWLPNDQEYPQNWNSVRLLAKRPQLRLKHEWVS